MKKSFIRIFPGAVLSLLISACVSQSVEYRKYIPGLGEIMGQIAMRHTKLWFAGAARNWELAQYEISELKEGFEQAEDLHPTLENVTERVPALVAANIQRPLERLELAVKARNPEQFNEGYESLTNGCNTCHRAAKFQFNKITTPNFNPYSNQDFKTEK